MDFVRLNARVNEFRLHLPSVLHRDVDGKDPGDVLLMDPTATLLHVLLGQHFDVQGFFWPVKVFLSNVQELLPEHLFRKLISAQPRTDGKVVARFQFLV